MAPSLGYRRVTISIRSLWRLGDALRIHGELAELRGPAATGLHYWRRHAPARGARRLWDHLRWCFPSLQASMLARPHTCSPCPHSRLLLCRRMASHSLPAPQPCHRRWSG